MSTGEVEIDVEKVEIIGKSEPLPIDLSGKTETNEDVLLKYRYLALRDKNLQKNLAMRHRALKAFRDFYDKEGFIEIETPIMAKSTPEGSRDYLVPSRIHPGKFYALPQSPQIFKQLLMLSGFEKYYQIARCFRDEDLRADRQPEFTQIDWEMSFVEREDLLDVGERALAYVLKEVLNYEMKVPVPRISWTNSMNTYGVDKPDTRFEMHLIDLTNILSKGTFEVFNSQVKNGGLIKAVKTEKIEFSRKEQGEYEDVARIYKAKGVAFLKYEGGIFTGTIAKFFSKEILEELKKMVNAKEKDLLFIVADKPDVVHAALGNIRLALGRNLKLIDEKKWNGLWVVDFPMFEKDSETGKLTYAHNPFSAPRKEHLGLIDTDPMKAISGSYDFVLNGNELGSGCIRIHDPALQRKIFKMIGLTDREIDSRFGFILNAYKYGAPIHGGFAFGFDRIAMLFAGANNLREVLAFPKNKAAYSLMDDSPSDVSQKQLDELKLASTVVEEEKKDKKN